jgi:hypothetical protein
MIALHSKSFRLGLGKTLACLKSSLWVVSTVCLTDEWNRLAVFRFKVSSDPPSPPSTLGRGKGVKKLWECPAIWTEKLQICDLALPYGPVVFDVETVWRTNITMYRGMHFAYQKPACMARPKRRNECRKANNNNNNNITSNNNNK